MWFGSFPTRRWRRFGTAGASAAATRKQASGCSPSCLWPPVPPCGRSAPDPAAGPETLDRAKRVPAYRGMQSLLRQSLPFLPICEYVTVEGTKAGLTGCQPNINVRLNAWNVNSARASASKRSSRPLPDG